MAAIFELEKIKDLPLWGQVLLASRMARRGVLWLPDEIPADLRELLIGACDELDRSAYAGQYTEASRRRVDAAKTQRASHQSEGAISALQWAADAALAARDSMDFSAAESACIHSTQQAIAHAAHSHGLSPLQVTVMAAADLDQIRFACNEVSIDRYGRLGSHVQGRMAPVHPPTTRETRRSDAAPLDER